MSEADLQRAVIDLCRWLGLFVWHDNDARRNNPGLPDLLIAGSRGHLFRELKSAKGRTRPEQMDWLARLTQGGADAAIWRPADLTSGRIETELKEIR